MVAAVEETNSSQLMSVRSIPFSHSLDFVLAGRPPHMAVR